MTVPAAAHTHVSRKASLFTESVIREMTREAMKYGAVNLSQGFPDFAAPEDIKRVAMQAIADDINQYAITWGAKGFREAIAAKTKWYLGLDIDPESEITVTCGSTEGMIAAMMATVDPGEEVVVFEPFYENYAPDAILSDARPSRARRQSDPRRIDPGRRRQEHHSIRGARGQRLREPHRPEHRPRAATGSAGAAGERRRFGYDHRARRRCIRE